MLGGATRLGSWDWIPGLTARPWLLGWATRLGLTVRNIVGIIIITYNAPQDTRQTHALIHGVTVREVAWAWIDLDSFIQTEWLLRGAHCTLGWVQLNSFRE